MCNGHLWPLLKGLLFLRGCRLTVAVTDVNPRSCAQGARASGQGSECDDTTHREALA